MDREENRPEVSTDLPRFMKSLDFTDLTFSKEKNLWCSSLLQ